MVEPNTSVQVALPDLGRLALRRPFRPPELAAWDELLECIALHSPGVDTTADHMSWCMEPSDRFSARSLYRAIAPSCDPEALTDLWGIRLPLKIRIFMWQWIRVWVPSRVEGEIIQGDCCGIIVFNQEFGEEMVQDYREEGQSDHDTTAGVHAEQDDGDSDVDHDHPKRCRTHA
ncbi:putative TdLSC37 protein [Hordeum vulgare]|nr:putative TdLSC37 protein [Hordeum vulgare]